MMILEMSTALDDNSHSGTRSGYRGLQPFSGLEHLCQYDVPGPGGLSAKEMTGSKVLHLPRSATAAGLEQSICWEYRMNATVTRRRVFGLIAGSSLLVGQRTRGVLAQEAHTSVPSASADVQTLLRGYESMTKRNEQTYSISTPNGIDEGKWVPIGGIGQYISIRGEDRDNPVLLFLHGGPGDATNPWGYLAFRSWLKSFTVVQWDQRGSGRTLGQSGADIESSLTLERMTQDGVELAEYLCKTLHKDKLALVGHSWGSALGTQIAKARPELFYAYVGTGQDGDVSRNPVVGYEVVLHKAQTLGDGTALRELLEIGPPPYKNLSAYVALQKWKRVLGHDDLFIAATLGASMAAPGYRYTDLNDWNDGQVLSDRILGPQLRALDLKTLGGRFALPVYVIQGEDDFTTPTSLARNFFDSVQAPHKEFAVIKGAGHFAVFTNSDEFLQELVRWVRPFAAKQK
jgi:pimeloyl-ACP methyl ester carboxylesterase